MNTDSDTIAAVATAGTEGCISIVRLSGCNALRVADAISRTGIKPSYAQPNSILYGHITDAQGYDIDEVLLLILKAPKSYTCEDMVEIQGHGGRISATRILRRCLEAGARSAEPGEFTKRAFLNGRLDLLQAEAVQDLVKANSETAAKMALEQLEGGLSGIMNELYDALLHLLANLEATLDFSEEQLLAPVYEESKNVILLHKKRIHECIVLWQQGHILRDGASVAIIGPPNAGKSTLLNRLLGKERAIVSPTPGTTRDTIEESILLNGIPLRLTDTAGMRSTECHIEQEGIERTRQTIQKADLILLVLDASQPLSDDLRSLWLTKKKNNILLIINKIDIQQYDHAAELGDQPFFQGSLLSKGDADGLKEKMQEALDDLVQWPGPPRAVISERHRELLMQAEKELENAAQLSDGNMEENVLCIATHIREALEQIGKINGRVYYEELLDHIFSSFCIGK